MMSDAVLRVGTRASALARWQAEWVAAQLAQLGQATQLVPISTRGDREQSGPIAAISGGDGVFTKELQRALLADEIDVAVHSLKDLPTAPVEGLALAAVPARGPIGDLLVLRSGTSIDDLPPGAVVGTGSLRRRAQLLNRRADLQMADVRGNVDTRLRKLSEGQFDALCLAEAGLHRLGIAGLATYLMPREWMLPAVGQGALGIEIRSGDSTTLRAVIQLDDRATHASVLAERSFLSSVSGGCLAPVGAWGRLAGDAQTLRLEAAVLSVDGQQRLVADRTAPIDAPTTLGRQVAEELLASGAGELLAEARRR